LIVKRLAIIGTGIAGLGCAWLLHKRFRLTIFEQNGYAGGHTNTVTVEEAGRSVPIDTGFMVFNYVTYPLLTRLFQDLGVETKPTEMSFSVQHAPTGLEYNGGNVDLLFVQRRNLFRLRHWRMLLAIDRFNREAVAALDDPAYATQTLGEYIAARGYGQDMLDLYLVPMASAVWSTPPDKILEFPVMTLLRFWHNHGFLGLDTRHPWRTLVGGARSYVGKLTQPFANCIELGRQAVRVMRSGDRVQVSLAGDQTREFDKAILACHGHQAKTLLADATAEETKCLGEFKSQPNVVTLHTDDSFMPRRRRCWASWNYRMDTTQEGSIQATTHYWMNSLQHVSPDVNYFVSLNCHDRIAPEKVLRRIGYDHPLFSLGAIRAQQEIPLLNQRGRNVYFAGAWQKYGFHEDGLASAVACARLVAGEELWP
jgi:uncharacterized protein